MTRKLLFVTGTRADFGKLEPLASAAKTAGFEVSFFVTGMHMMARYGLTKLEVQRLDGIMAYEFLNQRPNDPQDMVLAKTVMGFSDFVTEMRPDLIITHGDRVEALACTLVAATNYIRSGHVEGGEVSGTIDEIFRHCNTKLASAHFVSSDAAARRVMALGEPQSAVHVIGSPELDFHSRASGVTIDEVRARYGIAFSDFGICVFHPVTSEQATMGTQARDLYAALEASGRNFVLIAPNNDPGSEEIFDVINALPKERFRLLPSMRFAHFSELMKNAACMVGNSSAGVREAPFLGIPSLDIGTRQHNRSDAPSIRFADAGDANTIATFLDDEWGKSHPRHEGFGSGSAAERFAAVLNDPEFWARGLQKEFQDLG
ncbi:UDP-N-acetylglucosamine 2-epimerase (hydrolyzing) [Pseudorhodobacter turbinis]|uniref:UDP-N-acetylglucosamine 2-epimerase (Hydrolyzing) n=1 Tax=Pseudorhodobacter turbinis TaxID=2500533 RepID=A0A4P8EDR9_9RHOB|nr:UDP-N-acetylglucosamine 2-epimerase [Pseudorhodobacter turbinis]QCO54837.1 UDP-N-acetylglucosamine 2-epimerase (hydrolyzing) [Pseudorhodobacter turbinis]